MPPLVEFRTHKVYLENVIVLPSVFCCSARVWIRDKMGGWSSAGSFYLWKLKIKKLTKHESFQNHKNLLIYDLKTNKLLSNYVANRKL